MGFAVGTLLGFVFGCVLCALVIRDLMRKADEEAKDEELQRKAEEIRRKMQ